MEKDFYDYINPYSKYCLPYSHHHLRKYSKYKLFRELFFIIRLTTKEAEAIDIYDVIKIT